MKLAESALKQLITEETIVLLLKERKIVQAEQLLWESRQKQLLDEKWWKKLLGTWTPTDADIKDDELGDKLEDVAVDVIKTLRKSGRYTRDQAETIVKKYLSGDPDLTRVDHKDLTNLFFQLNKDQAAEIEKLEAEEDNAEAGGEAEEDIAAPPEKADTPMDAIKGIRDIVTDPADRKMLVRGLLQLLTNDSVERVLNTLKPAGAKDTVLAFIKQITDMEPKAYKKFKSDMHGKLYKDFLASEKPGMPGSHYKKERSGRHAGREVDARVGKLGLSENISKEITEKIVIFEVLNLYIEKKIKQEVA